MKTKKIFRRDLDKHDAENADCTVRELEMCVDANLAPGHAAYSMQFWKDAQLYGVDEAILYVQNGNYGNHEAIRETWERIKERLSSRGGIVNPSDLID